MKGQPRVWETDPATFCNSQEEGALPRHVGTRVALRHAKTLQLSVTCAPRPSRLPRVLQGASSCPHAALERQHRTKPTTSHLPGLLYSQHPQSSMRRDENRNRTNQSTCYAHKSTNQEAPYYLGVLPYPASPLTGAGRAEQKEHPEASAPGKPRRALSEAASRGGHSPRRVPGPAAHAGGGARAEGGGAAGPAR